MLAVMNDEQVVLVVVQKEPILHVPFWTRIGHVAAFVFELGSHI